MNTRHITSNFRANKRERRTGVGRIFEKYYLIDFPASKEGENGVRSYS
jgi:hypothetical protein